VALMRGPNGAANSEFEAGVTDRSGRMGAVERAHSMYDPELYREKAEVEE
jgi:hypothetical protein